MITYRRLTTIALAAIALLVATGATQLSVRANGGHFNPPKKYYLALGDSAAFGFQRAKFQAEVAGGTYDPASFNTGYVDDFARQMSTIRPGIRTVNFSCAGETTTTLIVGGCPYHTTALPLHDNYPVQEPQLEAAAAFLLTHRGQVSPITLNIGTNDEVALVTGCQQQADPAACIAAGLPTTLATIQANLDIIVGTLRLLAPDSEIILLQPPNPLALALGATSPVVTGLQTVITKTATQFDIRLADAFSPFTLATLCSYTLYCTPSQDVHPSDLGYSVIAQQVWTASGYASLH